MSSYTDQLYLHLAGKSPFTGKIHNAPWIRTAYHAEGTNDHPEDNGTYPAFFGRLTEGGSRPTDVEQQTCKTSRAEQLQCLQQLNFLLPHEATVTHWPLSVPAHSEENALEDITGSNTLSINCLLRTVEALAAEGQIWVGAQPRTRADSLLRSHWQYPFPEQSYADPALQPLLRQPGDFQIRLGAPQENRC